MRGKEREEQKICCCGAFTWAKVIAYIQIIYGSILLIISFLGLIAAVTLFSQLEEDAKDETQNEISGPQAKIVILTFCVLSLILSLFVLFMGILLLVGIRKDNTCCLTSWIVISIVVMLLGLLTTIFWWTSGGHHDWMDLIALAIQILIDSFGIWVVYICRREILRGMSGSGRV